MIFIKTVQELIKGFRASKGLSQIELAKTLGMSKEAYGKKERGDVEFTFKEVMRTCEVLDIPIEMLFSIVKG